MTDTGYEGQGQEEREVEFLLEPYPHMWTGGRIIGRLLRNGEPAGFIRVNSQEELLWLAKRLNGTYEERDLAT